MNSENIKLKGESIKIINETELKNNKNNDEITASNEEELKNIGDPLIHIREVSSFADSVINYFCIGICSFIQGCYLLEFFEMENEQNLQFYMGYHLVAGIVLYIIGIINWYEGKELIFLIDFILSFLFITLFLKNQNIGSISDYLGKYDNDNLQGIFYVMLFCFILIIGLSSKRKGFFFVIDYVVLLVSYDFLFAYKFFQKDLLKTIDGYTFIICGALFWITGSLKLLNSNVNAFIQLLEPSD